LFIGIVAGLQSGVAKNAYIHPIRALSCDGTGGSGNIINALDWLSFNAISPAVVSMSLASPASISIDQAITNFMDTKGILVVSKCYLNPIFFYENKTIILPKS